MTTPDRDRQIEVALSKVTALDSIILRPQAGANDASSETGVDQARRIALLEYQELEQLIRSSPAEPLPYLQLAQIYHGQGRRKDAIRVLTTGVQCNPEYEPLVVMHEDMLLEAAEKAVEVAQTAHANQPNRDSELHLQRTRVQLANEQIQFARHRLQRHPHRHELHLLWATGAAALEQYDDAVRQLDLAVNQPTLRAAAALKLGECHEALGRSLEALSSYRVAAFFRVPPPERNIQLAALNAGFHLATKLQLLDAARQFADKLIEIDPAGTSKIKTRLEALTRKE